METEINAQFLQKPEVRKLVEGQTALGRIGEVTDIAKVAAFLASDDGSRAAHRGERRLVGPELN